MKKGIKLKLGDALYSLGILEENGHFSINIQLKKSGNEIEYSAYSGGIEGNFFKTWLRKELKKSTSIKVDLTEIDEITNPEEVQELVESRRELLLLQYNKLKEKLTKEGLI